MLSVVLTASMLVPAGQVTLVRPKSAAAILRTHGGTRARGPAGGSAAMTA